MPDENGKRIVELLGRHIDANDGKIRLAHQYPIDSLPVSVREIAHYRNGYLESLCDHNETLGAVRRLLIAGGEDVLNLWCEVYDKDDDGRDSGSADPRQDGDHQS